MHIKDTLFWTKNRLLRRPVIEEYKKSLRSNELSTKAIDKINLHKRFNLVLHAKENVEFYRKFYANIALKKKFMNDQGFWDDIPVLEKSHIRAQRKQLLSKEAKKEDFIKITTGGSTGEPMVSFRDKRFPEEVLQWRMLERWNVSPAENKLMLWRTTEESSGRIANIKNKILWFPTIRIKEDVSLLSNEKMHELFVKSSAAKVGIVWGYVGAIFSFAEFLLKNDLVYKVSPKCIWVTASPISSAQREIISIAFNAPVLDQYACSEVHWVASGLPNSQNLILEQDYRHVDIIREDKVVKQMDHGVYGDLLLTDLHNYAFPLIKYRVGDRGAYADERWGSKEGFPMLSPVKGRVSDTLKTRSGKVLSGEYLTTVFDNYSGIISAFQFIQIDIENVEIIVVSDSSQVEGLLKRITGELEDLVHSELKFTWLRVEKIEHDRGKTRFIKSLL